MDYECQFEVAYIPLPDEKEAQWHAALQIVLELAGLWPETHRAQASTPQPRGRSGQTGETDLHS